jgi:hypothetical protein
MLVSSVLERAEREARDDVALHQADEQRGR